MIYRNHGRELLSPFLTQSHELRELGLEVRLGMVRLGSGNRAQLLRRKSLLVLRIILSRMEILSLEPAYELPNLHTPPRRGLPSSGDGVWSRMSRCIPL